jgi:hypothetical protein
MEPLIPPTNETSSTASLTPQLLEKLTHWWERIRLHIEPVSKVASTLSSVLLALWSIGLFVGGLIFLFYYWKIGFMPELDLKASVTLLAVSAITGSFLFLMLVMSVLFPSLIWINMIRTSGTLKGLWSDHNGKLLRGRVVAWLSLPIFVVLVAFSVAVFLKSSGVVGWWSDPGGVAVGLLIGGGIPVRCLHRKLADHLDRKQRWVAIGSFSFSFFWSATFFLLCVVILTPSMASVLTPFIPASYSDITAILFLVLLTLAVFLIACIDAAIVIMFFDSPDRRLLGIVALVVFLVVFLGLLGTLVHIPNTFMSVYKFGHLNNASLVLDEAGCTIAQYHGLKLPTIFKERTCRLDCVMIHSRLGSTYYVDAGRYNSTSASFTIPAQNVLSWGIASKAVLEGCIAKSSSPSASGSLSPSP